MMKCVYYITGHGYGHSTRSFKMVEALIDLGWSVTIVSIINHKFVAENLAQYGDSVSYIYRKLDAGAIQLGPLNLDLNATLESHYNEIFIHHDQLVRTEVAFLNDLNAKLVLVDATPLACQAGRLANAKVVVLSNLTWDFIYRDMLYSVKDTLSNDTLNKYNQLVLQCEQDYLSAHHYFQLPGPVPLVPGFDVSRLLQCPLMSREAKSTKIKVLSDLNITDNNDKILLLSFGGHSCTELQLQDDWLPDGWICLLLGFNQNDYPTISSSRFKFCRSDSYVPDLVAICDVFLGKIGYGTVSECLSTFPVTPLLYIPRDGWPEESYLLKILDHNKAGLSMSSDDFYAGNWRPYLEQSLVLAQSAQNYKSVSTATDMDDVNTSINNNIKDTHLSLVGKEAAVWIANAITNLPY